MHPHALRNLLSQILIDNHKISYDEFRLKAASYHTTHFHVSSKRMDEMQRMSRAAATFGANTADSAFDHERYLSFEQFVMILRILGYDLRQNFAEMAITLPLPGFNQGIKSYRTYFDEVDESAPYHPTPLDECHGNTTAVHPKHPIDDWRYEASNGDTSLGYWDWAASRAEASRLESTMVQEITNKAAPGFLPDDVQVMAFPSPPPDEEFRSSNVIFTRATPGGSSDFQTHTVEGRPFSDVHAHGRTLLGKRMGETGYITIATLEDSGWRVFTPMNPQGLPGWESWTTQPVENYEPFSAGPYLKAADSLSSWSLTNPKATWDAKGVAFHKLRHGTETLSCTHTIFLRDDELLDVETTSLSRVRKNNPGVKINLAYLSKERSGWTIRAGVSSTDLSHGWFGWNAVNSVDAEEGVTIPVNKPKGAWQQENVAGIEFHKLGAGTRLSEKLYIAFKKDEVLYVDGNFIFQKKVAEKDNYHRTYIARYDGKVHGWVVYTDPMGHEHSEGWVGCQIIPRDRSKNTPEPL